MESCATFWPTKWANMFVQRRVRSVKRGGTYGGGDRESLCTLNGALRIQRGLVVEGRSKFTDIEVNTATPSSAN